MSDFLAQDVLDRIPAELMIDEEWSVRCRGRLSWVGHELRQDFTVSDPWTSLGTRLVRLASSIPVVEDVACASDDVVRVLAALNRFVCGEALVWDDLHRRLLCCSGAVVHRETLEWRVRQLTTFSIMALIMTERLSATLADRLGGTVARWAHPDSGGRQEPDEMLGVLHDVIMPAGHAPSRFAREGEFEEIATRLESTPFFSLGGSPEGIAVEAALGEHDTILVHAQTATPHPVLGSGLLVTTKVRPPAPVEQTPAWLAATLNLMESTGGFEGNSFGAWCTDGEGAQTLLAHALFVPNVLYRPGVTQDVVWNALRRAAWVAGVLLESDSGVRAYD
jgi:hypothetical protein